MRNSLRALGQLGLLCLLAASGPCSSDRGSTEPAQSPPPPPPQAGAPRREGRVEVMDTFKQATEIVDRIAHLPQLSQAAVEGVVGTAMTPSTTARPGDRYYEAALADGPFERVEIRVSNPSQASFALVILDVRPGVDVPLARFRSEGRVQPSTPMDVNPRVPPEGTITFSHVDGDQTVRYEFRAKSQILSGAMVERRPAR